MRSKSQGRGDRHYVDDGVVWCPRVQADVDIERCFECERLQWIGDEGDGSFVQCRPYPAPVPQCEIR